MYSMADDTSYGGRMVKDTWALKRNEPSYDEYYEAELLRTSRLLLGLLGGIPFTWRKPHTPSRDLSKSTFAIAIVIVSILGLLEYHLIVSCCQNMLDDNTHLKDLIMYVEVQLYSLFYFLYFTLWLDVPALEKIITTWHQLSKTYNRLTGQHLKLRRRSFEKKLNVAVVVFPVVSAVLASLTNPQIEIELAYYPVFALAGTSCLLFACLWIVYFDSLQKLSKNVNAYLQKDLENDSLTLKKLQDYREIWLTMRSFSACASSMYSPVLVYMNCLVLIILLFYEMIVLFECGNIYSAIAHTNLCICCVYFIHYMANASANAVQEIKEFYTNILARESLYSLIPNTQREVIGLCLVRRTGSPVPSYGGFVILNRAQALSVFAAISAYLVLLMQFSQKINEIESRM